MRHWLSARAIGAGDLEVRSPAEVYHSVPVQEAEGAALSLWPRLDAPASALHVPALGVETMPELCEDLMAPPPPPPRPEPLPPPKPPPPLPPEASLDPPHKPLRFDVEAADPLDLPLTELRAQIRRSLLEKNANGELRKALAACGLEPSGEREAIRIRRSPLERRTSEDSGAPEDIEELKRVVRDQLVRATLESEAGSTGGTGVGTLSGKHGPQAAELPATAAGGLRSKCGIEGMPKACASPLPPSAALEAGPASAEADLNGAVPDGGTRSRRSFEEAPRSAKLDRMLRELAQEGSTGSAPLRAPQGARAPPGRGEEDEDCEALRLRAGAALLAASEAGLLDSMLTAVAAPAPASAAPEVSGPFACSEGHEQGAHLPAPETVRAGPSLESALVARRPASPLLPKSAVKANGLASVDGELSPPASRRLPPASPRAIGTGFVSLKVETTELKRRTDDIEGQLTQLRAENEGLREAMLRIAIGGRKEPQG